MNKLLKEAKNVVQEGCVTITLNTHRTKPDYNMDPINLKNRVKEAEECLYEQLDKRFVWQVMDNLNRVVESIDHSMNIESLVIFANRDFANYTRLPVSVQDRVVVDRTFATRDLIRAMYQETSYYILVLTRDNARLIEAFNDKAVRELSGEFPLVNPLFTPDRLKRSMKEGSNNYIEEFFNQVDKALNAEIGEEPLPVILYTERRNYDYYIQEADRKDLILGHVSPNGDEDKTHDIVERAWVEVLSLVKKKNEERIAEVGQAIGENKVVTGYGEIWEAIKEGRGKTLFVKKGFYQPVVVNEQGVSPLDGAANERNNIVEDIVDDMIEQNLALGGDAVFVEGDQIEQFDNLVLITRY